MYDLTQDYPDIRDALRDALAEAVADKLDRYGIYADGAECVREISAESFDGFIAHTNGGFRVLVPCTLRDAECEGLTDFEAETLQSYIDQSRADAAAEYIRARPELNDAWQDYTGPEGPDVWLFNRWEETERRYNERYHAAGPQTKLPGIPDAPAWHLSDDGHEVDAAREEYWLFEDEWLTEGSTFFYEIGAIFYERGHRRNNTGADEVFIFAGINTDFEYGRDGNVEPAIERDYKLARLTPARVRAIVDAFTDKL